MKQKTTRKRATVALTAAEHAARRQAEEALRTGLPMCGKTLRHLATARRKMNLLRYGKAEPFPTPAPVACGAASHHY